MGAVVRSSEYLLASAANALLSSRSLTWRSRASMRASDLRRGLGWPVNVSSSSSYRDSACVMRICAKHCLTFSRFARHQGPRGYPTPWVDVVAAPAASLYSRGSPVGNLLRLQPIAHTMANATATDLESDVREAFMHTIHRDACAEVE